MSAENRLKSLIAHMRTIGNDTQDVEVKTAGAGLPTTLAESISAMANGSGGTIILGLAEKEGFVPTPSFNARSCFDGIATICADKLTPPVRADISIREFEGSQIVVANVPETTPAQKPCFITSRGMYQGSFIRTGDGDRKLTHYEIDRLVEEQVQPHHDIEIVEGATLADLDPDLVAGVLSRQRQTHPRVFGKLTDEEALTALNITAPLPTGGVGITLAALLALGVYPQHFFPRLTVQFACYPGTEKAAVQGIKFLDSKTMAGPIPVVLLDTVAAVRKNMRMGGVLVDGLRHDVPDYPENAVREAVCNALMHRDYSSMGRGSAVQVDLYPDRLEILSPGGLYGSVTVDMLGQIGASATRNQHLSNLLETTPYEEGGFVAENRGTGFNLIKNELQAAKMPQPIATDRPSLFTLTIRRGINEPKTASHQHSASNTHAAPDAQGLTNSSREVYEALAELGESRTSDIIEATGLSRATVVKALNKLMELGLVSVNASEPKNNPQRTYSLSEQ